ncbi:hypothetical protein Gotur_018670 [Gossypium turneri]
MLSNTAKSSEIKPEIAITIPKRCNIANRPIGYKCGGRRKRETRALPQSDFGDHKGASATGLAGRFEVSDAWTASDRGVRECRGGGVRRVRSGGGSKACG